MTPCDHAEYEGDTCHNCLRKQLSAAQERIKKLHDRNDADLIRLAESQARIKEAVESERERFKIRFVSIDGRHSVKWVLEHYDRCFPPP